MFHVMYIFRKANQVAKLATNEGISRIGRIIIYLLSLHELVLIDSSTVAFPQEVILVVDPAVPWILKNRHPKIKAHNIC